MVETPDSSDRLSGLEPFPACVIVGRVFELPVPWLFQLLMEWGSGGNNGTCHQLGSLRTDSEMESSACGIGECP